MNHTITYQQFSFPKQNVLTAMAFTVVTFLVVAPFLTHLYLPLVDLPNHIARHYLATSSLAPLEQYYDYEFRLVPNSAVDLIWILSGGKGDPTRFSQIVIALSSVTFVGATIILSRTVWGLWSAWPAAVGLVAYHASLFWGFQNYVVSLPFVLLGMALWIANQKRNLWVRLAIFAPYVSALYLMHFFAFIGFAVMVFGRELQIIFEAGRDWKRSIGRSAVMALPFLACLTYLIFCIASSGPSPSGSQTEWGSGLHRLEAIQSLTLAGELSLPNGLTTSGQLILVLLWIFAFFFLRSSSGPKLEFNRSMIGPALALCVLVVAAPLWLNGVAFVHIRFPVLLAATLFAATRWQGLASRSAVILAGVVLALILVRTIQFENYSKEYDREVRDFINITETLPPGSRVLPVRSPKYNHDMHLWHVSGYAVVYANVFIPTLFQGVHGLKVREEWRDHSTPALHAASTKWLHGVREPEHFLFRYVVDWQDKYDYVVMIDRSVHLLEPFNELVTKNKIDRFTLYEVLSSPQLIGPV